MERAKGIEIEQKRRKRSTSVFMKRPSVLIAVVYPIPENEHNCAQLGGNSYAGCYINCSRVEVSTRDG